jgi:NADPH-dependent curcumin reductase CurA
MQNTRVIFRQRPEGLPGPECYEIRSEPAPEIGAGDVLLRNHYISLDPYMRGRMTDRRSYVAGFQLGEVLTAAGVGEVVASDNPRLPVGSFVVGTVGWEHYTRVPGGRGLMPVDASLAPVTYYLGVLGMPGLTAYVGLLDLCDPQEGETVYVSAAAGAVGQVVGQLAKIRGCRVVGSAGSDAKVASLTEELGFDAAFNYKTADSVRKALAGACPDGVDVYFDNVGGETLDAALLLARDFARFTICGMISQYNLAKPEPLYNLISVLVRRIKLSGFIVTDHFDRMPAFLSDVGGWLREGKIKYKEDVAVGIEQAPETLRRVLTGQKHGKQLLKLV